MTTPPPGPFEPVLAAAALVNRSGGLSFNIAWTCPHTDGPEDTDGHTCPHVTWSAEAAWNGVRLIADGHPHPADAADALAVKVLTGGSCRCGRPVTLNPARPGCHWTRIGPEWGSACDAPAIPMGPTDRGDIPAMLNRLNRETRRRKNRKPRP